MIFNATELIAQAFDERNIKYEISETDESSILAVIFEVDTGLEEIVEFISTDDRNNVMVKISDLIQDVSPSKRADVIEACNKLNEKYSYFKFYLNSASNVMVEYDLPRRVDDECVGECCAEILVRLVDVIRNDVFELANVAYMNKKVERKDPRAIIRALRELRDTPIGVEDRKKQE